MSSKCASSWPVIAFLSLGCTPVHVTPSGAANTRTATSGKAATSQGAPPTPNSNPDASRPSDGSSTGKAKEARATAPRFQLRLPQDDNFVHEPLPFRDPGRYAKWAEQGKVQVGHGYLYGARFLDEERLVVVESAEEQAFRIYDAKTRRQVAAYNIPGSEAFNATAVPWPSDPAAVTTAAVTAASVTVASPQGVFRVSTSDGSTLFEVSNEPAHALRWSPDEHILVAVDSKIPEQTSTLRFFFRTEDGTAPLGSLAFEERVDGFALSPDNRLLAVAQYPSNTLRVLDLHTGETLLSTRTPNYVGSVDFSPDGRSLAFGGEALVVLDLQNPKRRAYYGHLYNNINTVRFSPSGDAVLTSSYDGRIRIFTLGEPTAPSHESQPSAWPLTLAKELRHEGRANVYGFDLRSDGSGLVSASGDQTVRWFGGKPAAKHGEPTTAAPREVPRLDLADLTKRWSSELGPGAPFQLDSLSAVRPTRLPFGRYACKITNLYRLRDCTVAPNAAGQVVLSFGNGNLLPLQAILYDDGKVTRFIGALREPSSIYDCNGCAQQPLLGVLRGGNGHYTGLLLLKRYFDPSNSPDAPNADVKIEEAQDRFPLTLKYVGPFGNPDTEPAYF